MKELVANRADVNVVNSHDRTSLMTATTNGHLPVVAVSCWKTLIVWAWPMKALFFFLCLNSIPSWDSWINNCCHVSQGTPGQRSRCKCIWPWWSYSSAVCRLLWPCKSYWGEKYTPILKRSVSTTAHHRIPKSQLNESRNVSLGLPHLKFTQVLIANGANLEAKDVFGWTPLITAAHRGHVEIVKVC